MLSFQPANGGVVMVNFYSAFVAGSGATIDDVIRHINHIRLVAGVDHVGIGGDYDGVDRQPVGLEDVSTYPELFDLLATSGRGYEPWTAADLKKLAGENILRVMRAVEAVARDSVNIEPYEDLIPDEDVYNLQNDQTCKTDFKYPVAEFAEQA